MSGAERLMFGSTTEGVLRRAASSVLVTPAAWGPPTENAPDLSGTGPIIAGVDLGESSAHTVAAACRLAALLGTSIDVVHVVPGPPVLARWRRHAELAVSSRVVAGREALNRLIESVGCEAPARCRVETGAVPEQLAAMASAASDRSPVLVLGRRERGAAAGPPGAIAYRALSLARVPVLMHVGE
jgi:nucleotide-binding universal stress UspA family protein